MAGGTVVGLDIGSSMMKVAELKRSGSGIEVTALGIAPTPPEAFDNSVIVDPQALAVEVKKLLQQSGITARSVVSSVSGQSSVVVRVIEVPKMDEKELAEAMKWEVERHVPFAVSEVIMDYQPIDRPEGYGDDTQMEVLMAVAQQDMIDRHVAMLQAAGLKPQAIDVEPLAIGRTLLELSPNGLTDGRTVAILNIGATNTDVGIFHNGLISFPRTLPLAGDNLTRAISEAFMVDMATAETYKREHGEILLDQLAQSAVPDFGGVGGLADAGMSGGFIDFTAPPPPTPETGATSSASGRMPFDFSTPGDAPAPAPSPFEPAPAANPFDMAAPEPAPAEAGFFTPGGVEPFAQQQTGSMPVPVSTASSADTIKVQVFNAMAPVLAELVQEIRRSLDYYRGKAADAQIDEILITGGTANLKNLAPFLEAELGIPTNVAKVLQNVTVSSKNFSQEHLAEVAGMFPISIGLGARDLVAAPAKAKRK